MAVGDVVSSAVKQLEKVKVANVVNNAHCPYCGSRLKDITDEFFAGKVDSSEITCFHVITTIVVKAVGRCPMNCRYKISKEGNWVVRLYRKLRWKQI